MYAGDQLCLRIILLFVDIIVEIRQNSNSSLNRSNPKNDLIIPATAFALLCKKAYGLLCAKQKS